MTPNRRSSAAALALLAGLALAGCGGDEVAIEDRSAEDIVAEADALLLDGSPIAAAELYGEVERLYPYSQLAKSSILRSAEAYYRGENYEEARLAAQRFLQFHPADPEAPRAQYLIANTWYDQIADVGRDQGATREALTALRETVARYPDTPEAREAQLKLDLALDHLAGKEMEVGRYYLRDQHYVAAINRFRAVVEDYQTTSHVPEALHRLVEAYLRLGVVSEAQTAAAVLGHNYPGSTWYASSFDLLTGANTAPQLNSDSWMARTWRQVILGEWL